MERLSQLWQNLKAPLTCTVYFLQHFGHQPSACRMQSASQRMNHTLAPVISLSPGSQSVVSNDRVEQSIVTVVSLHTQDPLKKPVIHSTLYFGGVWFAEFRVRLAQVALGLNSCRLGHSAKPKIMDLILVCLSPYQHQQLWYDSRINVQVTQDNPQTIIFDWGNGPLMSFFRLCLAVLYWIVLYWENAKVFIGGYIVIQFLL